ncbi:MAG: pre-peptidase C-terminal domain-containing protein [Phycisphaerales bacterium]|nr:pre-peptidase C-terminal domain-containing protein [Phycisphaerales bacterium]
MKTKLFLFTLALAAGTASAQNQIVNDRPGTFVDISGLAGAQALAAANADDVGYSFTSTVSNAMFLAGTVRPNSNGYVQFGGATGSATFTNAAIASGNVSPVAPTTTQALFPFWDDQYLYLANSANIYWIEGPAASFGLPANRGNVLIIQWTNIDHFLTSPEKATYQVQIFSNIVSDVAAQMLYQNVFDGNATYQGGGSATIGFAAGTTGGAASVGNVQWSFNTLDAVAPGTVLSVLVPGGPTNPSVSGSVNPAAASPNDVVLFTATPVGGINPNSTGLQVRGDLSPVGGTSNALFHDDGLNGDASAGDGVYSFSYTIPGAQAGGNYTVNLTVTDLQGRSGSGAITGNVFNPTDLGTLVDGTNVSTTVSLDAGEVEWYRVTVGDVSAAATRNLLITTANSTNGGDSEIGVFDSTGTLVAFNDDFGGNFSRLTFGYQGTSGDLAPGTYFIAVGSFNTTYTSPFGATSTGPANTFQLDILQTNSFPLTATGAVAAQGGGQFLLTVNVTPGVNPNSTGVSVVGDLSGVGGSATTAFNDNGLNGDVTAGDNIYSYLVTTPAADAEGQAYSVNWTVTDDQAANVTGTLNFNNNRDAAGDTLATANIPAGTGDLSSIDGFFSANDVDIYKIAICDSGNFSATTVGGTTADTQLFLFDSSGMGVTSNDDSTGLQSTITSQFIPGNGDYYLAVTRYNIDPVDASAQLIWNNTPFGTERAPDGPGLGNPLDQWVGAVGGTATYTVSFTGTCYPTNNTRCSPADVGMAGGVAGQDRLLNNNDFIAFITLFFAQDAQADLGTAGGVAGSDNAWDNNDFIAFISYFFNDQAACNG